MDYRQAEIRGPDYKYGLRYMTIEQYKILFFFFSIFSYTDQIMLHRKKNEIIHCFLKSEILNKFFLN